MVGSLTLLVALTMQLVVADVFYPPSSTSAPSPVTTTMAITTLPPDATTTLAPVVLMNAFMDNVRHMMSMYPSLAYVNAPGGYPVAPNYPPMAHQHYVAPAPVAPPMAAYNSYVPPTPAYGGMPPVPVNYVADGYAAANNYVSTARPAPYGAMPNNYGSPHGFFGSSNIYGIGSRPSGAYYGNGYHQQLPYNNNNAGYFNNRPSYPMNIAYHGPAW